MEYEKMDIDLLPFPLRQYGRIIGMDNLLKLAEAAGGKKIYIPKKDNILKYYLVQQVRTEYDGSNVQELAEKYGISDRSIYNYIKMK